MFIVIQPMMLGTDVLIYDMNTLTYEEANEEEFQSIVGKSGINNFVNVIYNSGTYEMKPDYGYQIVPDKNAIPVKHLEWYWEYDMHTLIFCGEPVRVYFNNTDLYIYINSKNYLLVNSLYREEDYIPDEPDELNVYNVYDYPMVTYIENVKEDESVLLLHYWLGNIFEEDIHILVDKESGEPLGVFYYDFKRMSANICDDRALEFAAKRAMIFGRGWWDWLVRKKN